MPLFNKYKIEHFKYGLTTDRLLSNKTMVLNGDDLQVEATNTVGKSMSIQTVIQGIRPLSDVAKPFKEVYTRKEPIYSAIEWILDDNETLLITGIGFEKKANFSNEEGKGNKYDLYRYFNFIIVESPELDLTIENLPFTKTLPNGSSGVQSLSNIEEWLKSLQNKYGKSKVQIFGNNSYARKEYKERLIEYGISQDEWKEVIIKLNNDNKEGGISEYLDRYDTVEKLIRDSLLPLIESSLSKDSDKMRILVIKDQVEKCLNNVIEMQDKLADYKNYIELKNFVIELQNKLLSLIEIKEDENIIKEKLASLYMFIENKNTLLLEEIETYRKQEEVLMQEIKQIKYEEKSSEYGSKINEKVEFEQKLNKVLGLIENEEKDKELNTQSLYILQYQDKSHSMQIEMKEKTKKEMERDRKNQTAIEIAKAIKEIGGNIHSILIQNKKELYDKQINIKAQKLQNEEQKEKLKCEKKKLKNKEQELKSKNESYNENERKYTRKINDFKEVNSDISNFITNNFLGEIINYEKYLEAISKEKKLIESTLIAEDQEIRDKTIQIDNIDNLFKKLNGDKQNKSMNLEKLKERKIHIDELKDEFSTICEKFEINEKLEDASKVLLAIKKSFTHLDGLKNDLGRKKAELLTKLNELEEFKTINFDEDLLFELERNNIKPVEGIKYLISYDGTIEYKISLINKNPLLPYSILVTENEYQKLKNIELKTKMKMSIPVLIRSTIEDNFIEVSSNLALCKNISILTSFDTKTLDPEQRLKDIQQLKEQILAIEERIHQIDLEIKELNAFQAKMMLYKFNQEDLNLEERISETSSSIITLENRIINEENNKIDLTTRINYLNKNKLNLNNNINKINTKYTKVEELRDEFEIVSENKIKFDRNEKELKETELKFSTINNEINILDLEHNRLIISETKNGMEIENLEKEITNFNEYELLNTSNLSLEDLKIKFVEYSKDPTSREITDLNREISLAVKRIEGYTEALRKLEKRITKTNFYDMVILYTDEELEALIKKNEDELKKLNIERESFNNEINGLEKICKHIKDDIFKEFNGKAPVLLSEIKDFNFEKRRKSINQDLKDIKEIIKNNEDLSKRLEIELVTLKKYRVEGKAIANEPKDVFEESKRLQNNLEKITKDYESIEVNYNNIFKEIEEFNLAADERYKKYVDGLLAYKDKYIKQKEQIERLLLVLTEEISKVEKHSEVVKNEKNLIARQIKDYIIDCIKEFRTLNKLGRHKGNELFNIRLPKDNMIENSLSIVDVLLDEIMEDMNPNDIKQKINTFYILNRVLSISNIPVSVITYELNRSGNIRWNDISNKTTGAQRFSIAFIMTVILLEYKRYDRNAVIDNSKNKGKVLLIDNPFGETSEEAILREIFDLAEKFNVQIISYTHVTNESVRKMFKKIYTMTVEKTTSGKEYVDINEIKNINEKEQEKVLMSSFRIGEREYVEQETMFDLIK